MKKSIKLFGISILIILLQNCEKEISCKSDAVLFYYNIADSNKAKIPYKGTDTLVFLSAKGDTDVFIAQGMKPDYNNKIYNIVTNSENCPRHEVRNYETITILFNGYNGPFWYRCYLDKTIQNTKQTHIEIKSYHNTNYGETTFEYLASKKIPDDSVFISNKYYSGNYIDSNKTVLFSNELGLIKFNSPNESWQLIAKK